MPRPTRFSSAILSKPSRALAQSSLVASMALVGAYVALSRPLTEALPIFLLAWLRFAIGAIAMLHWVRRPADEPALSGSTHGWLFLESLLGNFLFSICMLYGVALTSATTAGVIMAAIPACIAVLSWACLGERPHRRVGLSVLLAVLGIVIFTLSKNEQTLTTGRWHASDLAQKWPMLGPALLMGAVLCESAYAVIGKRLTGALGPRRISALINLWGLALMTPLGLYQAWSFDFGVVAPSAWALLLFYSLSASVWSVWLWMTGLKAIPAAEAGVFTVVLPIASALVGVAFLGERLTAGQWGAFGLALAGLLLATRPPR